MARLVRGLIVIIALAALAACGRGENDPGPGGVTIGEARALDRAADIIEQRRLPPEALARAPRPADEPRLAGR
jgi:hypothetical protein